MSARFEGIRSRSGWLLVIVLSAYILNATVDWEVPAPGGIRFGPAWIATTLAICVAARLVRGHVGVTGALAAAAASGMLLSDVTLFWSQGLRDFHLYLKAGEHYLAGAPVYLTGLVTERPADLTNYPFLYPPPLVPVFAAISAIPGLVADVGWVGLSIGMAVAGLRAIGVPLRWSIAALVWPPFAQGLYVGNVALPVFALFAFAPWIGSGLVGSASFKLYDGIAALWLVRERRWRALAVGVLVVLVVALATLPLTGIELWFAWIRGLDWYAQSQPLLPGSLYGIGLARYVPTWLVVVGGIVAALVALRSAGREGLARLGTATVIASPSLYAHGFLLAIPSLLRLRPAWLWFAIGLTSVAPGPGWWAGVAAVVAGWWLPAIRLRTAASEGAETGRPSGAGFLRDDDERDRDLHPLGDGRIPWPDAPELPLDDRLIRDRVERWAAEAGAESSPS